MQLGAFGDIINSLPAIAWEGRRSGTIPTVFVARDYVNATLRAGYVRAIPLPVDYSQYSIGLTLAQKMVRSVRPMQIFGHGYQHKRTSESFQRDAWERIGMGHRWEQIGLTFAARDAGAEARLTDAIRRDGRPLLLINHVGKTAPFPGTIRLLAHLYQAYGRDFQIVDLSITQAENIVDMLGLFDQAEALITIDTATLHLAAASSMPVIALVNHQPWIGSLPRANHLRHIYYDQWTPESILSAVDSLRTVTGKIAHVYPWWKMSQEDLSRTAAAIPSWKALYAEGDWAETACVYDELRLNVRNAKDIGDPKSKPFIKDVIEWGFCQNPEAEAVVYTNTDVGITPGTDAKIRRLLGCKGAFYAYRFDHAKAGPMSYLDNVTCGTWNGGIDMIGVTRQWWEANRDRMADSIVGSTMWDLHWRDQIKQLGGGELYGCLWHEIHPSSWQAPGPQPANEHNIRLYEMWKSVNDRTRPFRWKPRTA